MNDAARVTLSPSSSIELVKTASAVTDLDGNGPDAGDTVRYTFEARNTGAVTLAPLTLTDDKLGLSDAPCAPTLAPGASALLDTVTVTDPRLEAAGLGVTCEATRLEPGERTHCDATGAYRITAADMAAGQIVNTANAVGTSRYDGLPSPPAAHDAVTISLARVQAPGGGVGPVPPGPTASPSPSSARPANLRGPVITRLPVTGAELAATLQFGLLALGLGVVIAVAARRQRRSPSARRSPAPRR